MYVATYVFLQDINDSGQDMDDSEEEMDDSEEEMDDSEEEMDDSGIGKSLEVNSYVANM